VSHHRVSFRMTGCLLVDVSSDECRITTRHAKLIIRVREHNVIVDAMHEYTWKVD